MRMTRIRDGPDSVHGSGGTRPSAGHVVHRRAAHTRKMIAALWRGIKHTRAPGASLGAFVILPRPSWTAGAGLAGADDEQHDEPREGGEHDVGQREHGGGG